MIARAFGSCLFAVLVSPLCLAADTPPPDAPVKSDVERWDHLQKQLSKIGDDLKELQKLVDLGERARAVESKTIRERLDQLEKSLASLQATTRSSSYLAPAAPGATGTIRLVNRSAVPATVFLGGRPYALPPLQTAVLESQPAGNFTYSVVAENFGEIRAPLTRILGPGETFTITINP